MSNLRPMDLAPVLIDAEMVGKLFRLACSTMSDPTNEDCDEIAVNLLDSALDAALAKFDGQQGVVDLTKAGAVKLEVCSTRALRPIARKGGAKQ